MYPLALDARFDELAAPWAAPPAMDRFMDGPWDGQNGADAGGGVVAQAVAGSTDVGWVSGSCLRTLLRTCWVSVAGSVDAAATITGKKGSRPWLGIRLLVATTTLRGRPRGRGATGGVAGAVGAGRGAGGAVGGGM